MLKKGKLKLTIALAATAALTGVGVTAQADDNSQQATSTQQGQAVAQQSQQGNTDQSNDSVQTQLDNTKQEAATAQNNISQLNSNANQLKGQMASYQNNSFVIPSQAVNAYNTEQTAWSSYYNNGNYDQTKKAAFDEARNNMYQALSKAGTVNTFKHSDSDKTVAVDVNNLTTDQQNDLNYFAADIINKARQSWGSNKTAGLVVPTTGVDNLATDIANGYHNDGWSLATQNNHDLSAVTTAANNYGLDATGNYYENVSQGFFNTIKGITNMDTLKEAIYNTINNMIFYDRDSGNGHMESLLGLNFQGYLLSNLPADERLTYLGTSTNTLSAGDQTGLLHLILVPNLTRDNSPYRYYISDWQKFAAQKGTDLLSNLPTTIETAIAALNQQLTTQQASLKALQAHQAQLQQQLQAAEAKAVARTSQEKTAVEGGQVASSKGAKTAQSKSAVYDGQVNNSSATHYQNADIAEQVAKQYSLLQQQAKGQAGQADTQHSSQELPQTAGTRSAIMAFLGLALLSFTEMFILPTKRS